jgi:hypothetical protein
MAVSCYKLAAALARPRLPDKRNSMTAPHIDHDRLWQSLLELAG